MRYIKMIVFYTIKFRVVCYSAIANQTTYVEHFKTFMVLEKNY